MRSRPTSPEQPALLAFTEIPQVALHLRFEEVEVPSRLAFGLQLGLYTSPVSLVGTDATPVDLLLDG